MRPQVLPNYTLNTETRRAPPFADSKHHENLGSNRNNTRRREMAQLMRARRTERHAGENVEKIGLAGQIKCRAFGPRFMRLAEPRPHGRGYYCTGPSGLVKHVCVAAGES